MNKSIRSALVSVYSKEGLEPLIRKMHAFGIELYSTGGTREFITSLGIPVNAVEDLTGYPSILGGRVKTLHPKVFGGILARQDEDKDMAQLKEFAIPTFDLVIVDLYPFEKTVALDAAEADIIEKIDIGGISLIRAAAKNFNDVLIIPSVQQYAFLQNLLDNQGAQSSLPDRKTMACEAFAVSSHYDSQIWKFFDNGELSALRVTESQKSTLRYGENPHQRGYFFGNLDEMFEKLAGKELSYNNLLDVDAAVSLMAEFPNESPAFAILKHNNACGVAVRPSVAEAYESALACDPVSAFGGILISNVAIDLACAEKIHPLFCEVVIAPAFEASALELLSGKSNRILLRQKSQSVQDFQFRTLLNGVIAQDRDSSMQGTTDLKLVTSAEASASQIEDLILANRIVKHTRSNTVVLVKNGQLCASGTGQTSRVDALRQAIDKAKTFEFDLQGAVMASDAFFPFPDCVEIADNAGIVAVVQPGGSIKDQLSIDYCNAHKMAMYFTGVRHFRH